MKEYNIVEDRNYLLVGTTARVEQALADMGIASDFVIVDDSPDAEVKNPDLVLQEILKEGGDRLIRLCNIMFRQSDFTKADELDIDKSAVREAVMDFFYRDLVTIERYSNFLTTSSLPT